MLWHVQNPFFRMASSDGVNRRASYVGLYQDRWCWKPQRKSCWILRGAAMTLQFWLYSGTQRETAKLREARMSTCHCRCFHAHCCRYVCGAVLKETLVSLLSWSMSIVLRRVQNPFFRMASTDEINCRASCAGLYSVRCCWQPQGKSRWMVR